MSSTLANQLISQGRMTVGDFIAGTTVRLADGSSRQAGVWLLRSVTIGGITINNVECLVGGPHNSLLLGMSVLNRFSSWKIDNRRGVLVVGG